MDTDLNLNKKNGSLGAIFKNSLVYINAESVSLNANLHLQSN